LIIISSKVVKKVIGTKNTKKILETIQTGLEVLSGQVSKVMKAVENLEEQEKKQTARGTSAPKAKKATRKKPSGTTAKGGTKGRQKPKAAAASRKRTPKQSTKSATDQVVEIVNKSNKPLDVAAVAQMTDFDQKKVRGILSRAAKLGRINRAGRGIYVAGN
jgi:hypothetical protein